MIHESMKGHEEAPRPKLLFVFLCVHRGLDDWSILMLSVFGRGLVLGLSIAAPVGPIGVLCIRRTLASGRIAGFMSGLGAATADGIYGGIAALGLAAITRTLVDYNDWLHLFGGLFLLYLGWRTMISRPAREAAVVRSSSLLTAYTSTLVLTLTNPLTILSFTAIFAGVGVASDSAGWLVAGVFCGSALWWLTLSGGVGLLRERAQRVLPWINRISGAIICGFGIITLIGWL